MNTNRPDRAPTGRHTLGSFPESQEPQDTRDVFLPSLPPFDNRTDGAEPTYTIYGRAWYEARERVFVIGPVGRLLATLLDEIEVGWHAVRDLQFWAEANPVRMTERDAYGFMLAFIQGDLVDVYRDLAGSATEFVPGWRGWRLQADPDGLLADVETFSRYLAMLRLATRAEDVPPAFAALVESVDARLTGWGEEVAALVSACAAEMCLE